MANSLPITIQMSALPPSVRWTPQNLGDAIAERLSLVTAQSFALFVSGATAPLSNVGPWFNTNTNKFKFWDGTQAIDPATNANNSITSAMLQTTPLTCERNAT